IPYVQQAETERPVVGGASPAEQQSRDCAVDHAAAAEVVVGLPEVVTEVQRLIGYGSIGGVDEPAVESNCRQSCQRRSKRPRRIQFSVPELRGNCLITGHEDEQPQEARTSDGDAVVE